MQGVALNTWYRLTLTVNDVNAFKTEIRQRDSGAGYVSTTLAMPTGRSWHYKTWMYYSSRNAWLDNYIERSNGTQTTVYIGGYFEKNTTTGVATSYYAFNGQNIAMRQGSTVSFLHGDHLGSASVTTNNAGTKIAEMRYAPFGETRYQWSNTPTDKRFTSQRIEGALGSVYDYNARFFNPLTARFLSADSIVPGAGNPQNFNRYSYVNNRPLNLVDPTGHCGKTPEGKDPCATGRTATTPAQPVKITGPLIPKPEMKPKYRGNPKSPNYRIYVFNGYTAGYAKGSVTTGPTTPPGSPVQAQMGAELYTQSEGTCFSGNCPSSATAGRSGGKGVVKGTLVGVGAKAEVGEGNASAASAVVELGPFGLEGNSDAAEMSFGTDQASVALGLVGKDDIVLAIKESDAYALGPNVDDVVTKFVRKKFDNPAYVINFVAYEQGAIPNNSGVTRYGRYNPTLFYEP